MKEETKARIDELLAQGWVIVELGTESAILAKGEDRKIVGVSKHDINYTFEKEEW